MDSEHRAALGSLLTHEQPLAGPESDWYKGTAGGKLKTRRWTMGTGVEDRAVAVVESLRGKVARGPNGEVLQVNLHSSKDAWSASGFSAHCRFSISTTPLSLDIAQTHGTDAGLRHLRRLSLLSALKVANTAVTDAGLTYLRELPSLRWLVLTGTQVSEQAVKEFERAMPGLTIKR